MENTLIKIDRLALEGDGVGRISTSSDDKGKVAFVPYTLPAESVACRKTEEKKNYSRWLPLSVHQSSPGRQEAPCPHHFSPGKPGVWCGGCNWQHMKTASQRAAKKELVRETLQRLGGIPRPDVQDTLFTVEDWRYRNKVQIPFAPRGESFAAGFYAPGSHDIVEFEDCPIQPEFAIRIFNTVKKMARERSWPAYDKDFNRGWLRHLLIRANSSREALLALVTKDRRFEDKEAFIGRVRAECPEVAGIFQNIQPAQTNVILGEQWEHLWGTPRLREKMCGLDISFSIGAFMQVNTRAAEVLYNKAIELSQAGPEWTTLDLYCGVGVMTLLAARRMRKAVGVEESSVSVADAHYNALQNRVSNVSFIRDSVEGYFRKNFGRGRQTVNPERMAVIVDPPRSGLKPEVVAHLLRVEPAKLVYVSCDPATLARDLKQLSRKYAVGPVCPVDLFPQTAHIETVVSMTRRN